MIFALLAAALQMPSSAGPPVPPGSVVAAAKASEWVTIAPDDLLVMDLAPDAAGRPRRVVIQLMPAPFSQGWVRNIRVLARAHWWDGLSVNRVQDNYVTQWGDPDSDDKAKAKPLPGGLEQVREDAYGVDANSLQSIRYRTAQGGAYIADLVAQAPSKKSMMMIGSDGDNYAPYVGWEQGFAVASDFHQGWPVHCYAAVGVGRDLSPDTGTGAELYTVIGTPPRQLDRNIALVGRVVQGIEHLSSLPRGTGDLGFYKTAAERVPIRSVRLASELPEIDRPRFEYLSTESDSFARYVQARANRHDAFYIRPAGGVDICNAPVPVRRQS